MSGLWDAEKQLGVVQAECSRLLLENRLLKRAMSLNDYQTEAARTDQGTMVYMKNNAGEIVELPFVYHALGLGESGEVQNKIKKILRDHQGNVTDEMKYAIKCELGDTLWYVAGMGRVFSITLEDIARTNIERLRDRATRGVIKGSGDNR